MKNKGKKILFYCIGMVIFCALVVVLYEAFFKVDPIKLAKANVSEKGNCFFHSFLHLVYLVPDELIGNLRIAQKGESVKRISKRGVIFYAAAEKGKHALLPREHGMFFIFS